MSVHEQARMRKRQADAMAAAQAWSLTVSACAVHHGHPHARDMLNADIKALTETGGVELVAVALGDLLADSLGVSEAIAAGSTWAAARSADAFVCRLASLLAGTVDYDGERATAEMNN